MRNNTHRTAVTGGVMAAVLAVGSLTGAGPAAGEAAGPVSAAPATAAVQLDLTGVAGTGSGILAMASSSTWTPGTEKDDDGNWVGYIECCGGFIHEEVGTYPTRREARRAAKKAAEEANGFMDGPGCDDPFVLC